MAADTPVVVNSSESGVRLDAVYLWHKTPYSGAGTQREVRWQASKTNGPFPVASPVFDTLLRENDDRDLGDDWVEVEGALAGEPAGATRGLESATTYYVSCQVRNSLGESSAWATSVSFTTETARLTAAVWTASQ